MLYNQDNLQEPFESQSLNPKQAAVVGMPPFWQRKNLYAGSFYTLADFSHIKHE